MAAEFYNLTSQESNDSATAVDAIVSQAIDSSILEQIAAINSPHLSCSSSLPTNLEARFQKLKSFPISNRPLPSIIKGDGSKKASPATAELSSEAEIISTIKPEGTKDSNQKLRYSFSSSSMSSERLSRESPSPPRRGCWFGCSTKKKKSLKEKPKEKTLRNWGKNDEILTDLTTFSFKEQQRELKKALKEEERVSLEAAKVVEWVKHASARMDEAAIDELMSEEDEKYNK